MRKKLISVLCFLLCLFISFASFMVPADAATFEIDFETSSKALFLLNLDTDTTIYEKNADEKLPMASITKVMTYIVAYENIDDLNGTIITVDPSVEQELSGTGSSMSGIITGEQLTAMQMLNMMMVPSGNDAALALAKFVGGDTQTFVDMMNEKAKQLGCENTHFTNSHGLHDENHYSTARDVAIFTKYALSLPFFAEITNQVWYTLPATNMCETERTVYTTNRMINQNANEGEYYYSYAKGIKTGSHDQAGFCFVSTAVQDGYSYLCVALGSPSIDAEGNDIYTHGEMLDTRNLYRWAFENLELKALVKEGDVQGEVKVDYAWNKDSVLVCAAEGFSAIMPSSVETSSILFTLDLPERIEAPIEKGEVLGSVTLQYADQTLKTIPLQAMESVERSEILKGIAVGKSVLTSNWFLSIIGIIIFLAVSYIVLAFLYNYKKKKMRQIKTYKHKK